MTQLLKDKIALITGGASGIGQAIVQRFVQHGAKVVIADLNADLDSTFVNSLGAGNAIFVRGDTSNAEDCEKMVNAAVENFGALHIAVNNAGIGGPAHPVADYPIAEWKKVVDINLNGVFYGMHYQLPELIKTKGCIINMSSILGMVGFAQSSAYVAAKHGVIGLTKSAALEYGASGIRVNAIGPGFIHTPMVDNSLTADVQQHLSSKHALGRLGSPEEVAELALWLASDQASFVTGAYYPVDGGYLAQ